MALWLVRAGRDGEHAALFAEQGRVGVGFRFPEDISQFGSRDALMARYQVRYPGYSTQQVASPVGQMWTLARVMESGSDHIIVPFKRKRAFRIAKVVGDYIFDPSFLRKYRTHGPSSGSAKTSLGRRLTKTFSTHSAPS